MPPDPTWYARVWEYASSVIGYWQFWVAVAFMIERAFERYCPTLVGRIDPYLTPERRRKLFVWIGVAAFVYANFRAFDDVSSRLREAQRHSDPKRIEDLQAQLDAVKWAPLTNDETSALGARVRTLPPEEMVIACETVNCKDLADGLAAIFHGALGWDVKVLHRGGLDISGVTGIQLIPREPATELLKDAIESTTKLKVTMGDETREQVGGKQIFLTVGNKPF